MKNIKVEALANDTVTKASLGGVFVEVLHYEERVVKKDLDVLDEYTFDALLDSGKLFVRGIWFTAKGFFGMTKWAAVTVFSGLRVLWKGGVGKKKAEKTGGER